KRLPSRYILLAKKSYLALSLALCIGHFVKINYFVSRHPKIAPFEDRVVLRTFRKDFVEETHASVALYHRFTGASRTPQQRETNHKILCFFSDDTNLSLYAPVTVENKRK